jgi:hypothetical protein
MGEGERLLHARRKRLWGSLAVLAIAGGTTGFAAGFYAGHQELGPEVLTGLPDAVKFAAVGIMTLAFFFGCYRFAAAVDELEIADNLWSSTASYYFYAAAFPAWWALWKLEAVGEPRHWLIYFGALAAGGAIYLWRKWRHR